MFPIFLLIALQPGLKVQMRREMNFGRTREAVCSKRMERIFEGLLIGRGLVNQIIKVKSSSE